MRKPGKQRVFQILVPFQYIQCLLIQRNSYRVGVFQFGLLRDILHTAVNDVRLGQPVQVADTAADKALEHEYVTVDRIGCTQSAQIGIVHFVPLFKSKIERVTIHGLGNLVLVKRIVSCQSALDAPLDDGTDAVETARHAVFGTLLLDIAAQFVLIECRVHIHIPVFFLYPELEVPYVICRDGVDAEVESALVHDLVPETLVAQHLVEIVQMVLHAVVRKRSLVDIFLYLI